MGYCEPIILYNNFRFYLTIDGLILPRGTAYNSSLFNEATLAAYVFFEMAYVAIEYLNNLPYELPLRKQFVDANMGNLAALYTKIKSLKTKPTELVCPQDLENVAHAGNLHVELLVKSRPLPPSNPNKTGFVYLVQSPTGTYKIGKSKHVEDRVRTFSVKLPFEIELIHTIPCQDYHAAEREIHERFADKRVNSSEFYRLTEEDVAYIKSIERM